MPSPLLSAGLPAQNPIAFSLDAIIAGKKDWPPLFLSANQGADYLFPRIPIHGQYEDMWAAPPFFSFPFRAAIIPLRRAPRRLRSLFPPTNSLHLSFSANPGCYVHELGCLPFPSPPRRQMSVQFLFFPVFFDAVALREKFTTVCQEATERIVLRPEEA